MYVRSIEYYTYMPKLTLSVDEKVVSRAKRYAAKRGTSVSRIVEDYLDLVTVSPGPTAKDPPVLTMLRGAGKGTDARDYGRHLARKYR